MFAGGQVAGNNGDWEQILLRSPTSVLSLVHKDYRLVGSVVYLGWGLVLLAAVGIVLILLRRRADLPYAVLALSVVVLTLGPRPTSARCTCTGSSSTTCRSSAWRGRRPTSWS